MGAPRGVPIDVGQAEFVNVRREIEADARQHAAEVTFIRGVYPAEPFRAVVLHQHTGHFPREDDPLRME